MSVRNLNSDETKVVSLVFDNSRFDRNVMSSLSIYERLKESLNESTKAQIFDDIASGVKSISVEPLSKGLDALAVKMSTLDVIGKRFVENYTDSLYNLATSTLKKMSGVDMLTNGWGKYEEKTSAVQTIMAATADQFHDTGEQMAYVNRQLERLNWFTDETSYSFTDMTNNIGKFTNAGVRLDDAATAMMGISTWAAKSGAGIQGAARAMYNLSQAMSMGSVKLMDWNSIENANMGTIEFKQSAIDAAVALGTLTDAGNGLYKTLKDNEVTVTKFRDSLQDGWFTADVLTKTLTKYGGFVSKISEVMESIDYATTTSRMLQWVEDYKSGTFDMAKAMDVTGLSAAELSSTMQELSKDEYDFGRKAFMAAQEAKTFTEAVDSITDAVSSKWMQTWELIFGDYLGAKDMWTELANDLYDVFAEPGNKRNEWLKGLFDSKQLVRAETFRSTLETIRIDAKALGKEFNENENEIIEKIIAAGKQYGYITDEMAITTDNFIESLKDEWLTVDLLNVALGNMSPLKAFENEVEDVDRTLEPLNNLIKEIAKGSWGTGEALRENLLNHAWDPDNVLEYMALLDELTGGTMNLTDDILKEAQTIYENTMNLRAMGVEVSMLKSEQDKLNESFEGMNSTVLRAYAVFDSESGRWIDVSHLKTGELLATSLKNAMKALAEVVTFFRDTWDETGDGIKKSGIRSIIMGVYTAIEKFRYAIAHADENGLADKLKDVMTFARSVLGIFGSVFKAVGEAVKGITTGIELIVFYFRKTEKESENTVTIFGLLAKAASTVGHVIESIGNVLYWTFRLIGEDVGKLIYKFFGGNKDKPSIFTGILETGMKILDVINGIIDAIYTGFWKVFGRSEFESYEGSLIFALASHLGEIVSNIADAIRQIPGLQRIGDIVDAIGRFVGSIVTAISNLHPIQSIMNFFSGIFGTAADGAGDLATNFGEFVKWVGNLAASGIIAVFDAMTFFVENIGSFVKAIKESAFVKGIVDGITTSITNLRNTAGPVFEKLSKAFTKFRNRVKALIGDKSWSFDYLIETFKIFKEEVLGKIGDIIPFIGNIRDKIKGVIDTVAGKLSGFGINVKKIFENIKSVVSKAWNFIISGNIFNFDKITEAIRSAFGKIKSYFKDVKEAKTFSGAIEAVGNGVSGMFNDLGFDVSKIGSAIHGVFTTIADVVTGKKKISLEGVQSAVQTFFTDAATKVGELGGVFGEFGKTAVEALGNVIDKIFEFFKSIRDSEFVQNAITNISTSFTKIKNVVGPVLDRAGKALGDFWAKAKEIVSERGFSISSIFELFGAFKDTVIKKLGEIIPAFGEFQKGVAGFVGDINRKISGFGIDFGKIFENVKKVITGAWKFISSGDIFSFDKIVEAVKKFFETIKSYFVDGDGIGSITEFASGIGSGFSQMFNDLGFDIGKIFATIKGFFVSLGKMIFGSGPASIDSVGSGIKGVFDSIGEYLKGFDGFDFLGNLLEGLGTVAETVLGVILFVLKGVTDVIGSIIDFLFGNKGVKEGVETAGGIVTAFTSHDFVGAGAALESVGQGMVTMKEGATELAKNTDILKFLKDLANNVLGLAYAFLFMKTIGSVASIFKTLFGSKADVSKGFDAGAIAIIAGSIAALVGCIMMLSTLSPGQIATGSAIVVGMAGLLFALSILFDKLVKNSAKVGSVGSAILKMAVAIGILAGLVTAIAYLLSGKGKNGEPTIKSDELWSGAKLVGAALLAVLGVLFVVSKLASPAITAAKAALDIAKAVGLLLVIATVFGVVANRWPSVIWSGVKVISVTMALILGLFFLMKTLRVQAQGSAKAIKDVGQAIAMIAGTMLLLKIFGGNLGWAVVAVGAIAAIIAGLMVVMHFFKDGLSSGGKALKSAAVLIAVIGTLTVIFSILWSLGVDVTAGIAAVGALILFMSIFAIAMGAASKLGGGFKGMLSTMIMMTVLVAAIGAFFLVLNAFVEDKEKITAISLAFLAAMGGLAIAMGAIGVVSALAPIVKAGWVAVLIVLALILAIGAALIGATTLIGEWDSDGKATAALERGIAFMNKFASGIAEFFGSFVTGWAKEQDKRMVYTVTAVDKIDESLASIGEKKDSIERGTEAIKSISEAISKIASAGFGTAFKNFMALDIFSGKDAFDQFGERAGKLAGALNAFAEEMSTIKDLYVPTDEIVALCDAIEAIPFNRLFDKQIADTNDVGNFVTISGQIAEAFKKFVEALPNDLTLQATELALSTAHAIKILAEVANTIKDFYVNDYDVEHGTTPFNKFALEMLKVMPVLRALSDSTTDALKVSMMATALREVTDSANAISGISFDEGTFIFDSEKIGTVVTNIQTLADGLEKYKELDISGIENIAKAFEIVSGIKLEGDILNEQSIESYETAVRNIGSVWDQLLEYAEDPRYKKASQSVMPNVGSMYSGLLNSNGLDETQVLSSMGLGDGGFLTDAVNGLTAQFDQNGALAGNISGVTDLFTGENGLGGALSGIVGQITGGDGGEGLTSLLGGLGEGFGGVAGNITDLVGAFGDFNDADSLLGKFGAVKDFVGDSKLAEGLGSIFNFNLDSESMSKFTESIPILKDILSTDASEKPLEVTPVINTDGWNDQMAMFQSMLSDGTTLTPELSNLVSAQIDLSPAITAIDDFKTAATNSFASMENKLEEVSNRINSLAQAINTIDVVLNTGVLVGEMGPLLDRYYGSAIR